MAAKDEANLAAETALMEETGTAGAGLLPTLGLPALFVGCGCVIIFVIMAGMVAVGAYSLNNPSSDEAVADTGTEDATEGATIPGTVTELLVKKVDGKKVAVPISEGGKGTEIKLPTTEGKVGIEETVEALNAKGQHITFEKSCNTTEEKWYITMRWPYVEWAWNGRARAFDGTSGDYAKRRVVVYNPKTKKSVVTAICEAGPAPWTGSEYDSGNPPNYWTGYHRFDPKEYTENHVGRVAGLAPAAFKSIGAERNDILQYGFAADQSTLLGPVN